MLAVVLARRAARPARAFARSAVGLVAVPLVVPLAADQAAAATKLTLAGADLVAAGADLVAAGADLVAAGADLVAAAIIVPIITCSLVRFGALTR